MDSSRGIAGETLQQKHDRKGVAGEALSEALQEGRNQVACDRSTGKAAPKYADQEVWERYRVDREIYSN
jgi:hypothetical protein